MYKMFIIGLFIKVPKQNHPQALSTLELPEFGIFIQWNIGPNKLSHTLKWMTLTNTVLSKRRNTKAYILQDFISIKLKTGKRNAWQKSG